MIHFLSNVEKTAIRRKRERREEKKKKEREGEGENVILYQKPDTF